MFVFKICGERVFTKVQIIIPKKMETEEKLALMQADAEFEVGSDGDAFLYKKTNLRSSETLRRLCFS